MCICLHSSTYCQLGATYLLYSYSRPVANISANRARCIRSPRDLKKIIGFSRACEGFVHHVPPASFAKIADSDDAQGLCFGGFLGVTTVFRGAFSAGERTVFRHRRSTATGHPNEVANTMQSTADETIMDVQGQTLTRRQQAARRPSGRPMADWVSVLSCLGLPVGFWRILQ